MTGKALRFNFLATIYRNWSVPTADMTYRRRDEPTLLASSHASPPLPAQKHCSTALIELQATHLANMSVPVEIQRATRSQIEQKNCAPSPRMRSQWRALYGTAA